MLAVIAGCSIICGCSRSPGESGRTNREIAPPIGAVDSPTAQPTSGVTAGPVVPVSGAATTASGGACPRTGLWAECSVEKRLSQAGFVVQRGDPATRRRAGFSVAPTIYNLGKSRLEVFLYPTESAANADVKRIDTLSAAPKGTAGNWPMPPTFVRSANLVAVFLTANPTQAERLTLAIAAGAPQP
jgi:hypothetical protein